MVDRHATPQSSHNKGSIRAGWACNRWRSRLTGREMIGGMERNRGGEKGCGMGAVQQIHEHVSCLHNNSFESSYNSILDQPHTCIGQFMASMFLIISLDRTATLVATVAFACWGFTEFLARLLSAVRKGKPVAWFRQGETICLLLHKTNMLC
jgi:hypothetical protein